MKEFFKKLFGIAAIWMPGYIGIHYFPEQKILTFLMIILASILSWGTITGDDFYKAQKKED